MKYWNWMLPLAVVTAILLVVFCYVIPTQKNEQEYEIKKQLRILKTSNELLKRNNIQLITKIDQLAIQADSLKDLIQKDRIEMSLLKQRKDEKIDAITKYNDDELYRFFTNFHTDSTANRR